QGSAVSQETGFSVSAPAASHAEPKFVVSSGRLDPAEHPEPAVIRVRSGAADATEFTVRDHHLPNNHAPEPIVSGIDSDFSESRRHTLSDRGVYHDDDNVQGESGLYVEPRAGREAGPEFIHDDERS